MTAPLHICTYLCIVEAVGPALAVARAKELFLALPRQGTSVGAFVDTERPGYVALAESTVGRRDDPAHTWPGLLEAALRYPDPTVTLRVSLQTESQDSRAWVVRGGEELYFEAVAGTAGEAVDVLQQTGDPTAWANAPR